MWLLLVLAAIQTASAVRRGKPVRNDLIPLSSLLILLAAISSRDGFSRHIRYAMPVLPFACIWIGRIAQSWRQGYAWTGVILVGMIWSVVSSLSVYPYSLSYFNELAGGPMGGHAHLLGSNIDWGQDLFELKRWLNKHPDEHLKGLAYFGVVDPQVLGIEYCWPPATGEGRTPEQVRQDDSRVGLYAISVNFLRGSSYPTSDGQGQRRPVPRGAFEYFRRFRPVATIGYSIYIYRVGPASIEAARQHGPP
jgi:hypothetical protein